MSRTAFASLICDIADGGSILPLNVFKPEDIPERHSLWACWDEDYGNDPLPTLVVVADDDLNDFLAWAATFLPNFQPLTSFIRVLPWTVFSILRTKRSGWGPELSSVLVGGILGETMTNAIGRGFIEALPLTAYESTYSFAISRALVLGLGESLRQDVSDGWHSARQFTDQPLRRIPVESLKDVWSVVIAAARKEAEITSPAGNGKTSLIEESCREIRKSGRLSGFHWNTLSGNRAGAWGLGDSMRSTKEDRVEAFEKAVKALSKNIDDELTTSFLVGYLASLVSDGSLEHGHLVFPLLDQLPTAMLWYGVCVGLMPNSRIRADYNHLGSRILRLLNRPEQIVTPPTCDISLAELRILLRGNMRAFRQSHASLLRVEVVPMVTVVLRWSGRQTTAVGQMGLFGGDDHQNPLTAESVRRLINSLRGTLSLAEGLLGTQAKSSQGVSEPSKGKRRR